jgi:hypothetical protein
MSDSVYGATSMAEISPGSFESEIASKRDLAISGGVLNEDARSRMTFGDPVGRIRGEERGVYEPMENVLVGLFGIEKSDILMIFRVLRSDVVYAQLYSISSIL